MRNPNQSLTVEEVKERLEAFPELFDKALLVGKWIWIDSPDHDKLSEIERAFLKKLGFIFSKHRQAWRHCCGTGKSRRARGYHPKDKYGEIELGSV